MSKSALVTGASEGIGREIARLLARNGYRVTAVSPDEERLRELSDELGADVVDWIAADLLEPEGLARVRARVAAERFDVLVNNAGIGAYGRFDQIGWSALECVHRLNTSVVLELSYAYLSGARPGDALLNLGSIGGYSPWPGHAIYNASKAFVCNLSQALWKEQRERAVYVAALCPGVVRTGFGKPARMNDLSRARGPHVEEPSQVARAALRALETRRDPIVFTSAAARFLGNVPRIFPFRIQALLAGEQLNGLLLGPMRER